MRQLEYWKDATILHSRCSVNPMALCEPTVWWMTSSGPFAVSHLNWNINEHQNVFCFNRTKISIFFKFKSTEVNLLSCLVCLSGKMADSALWLVRSPVNQALRTVNWFNWFKASKMFVSLITPLEVSGPRKKKMEEQTNPFNWMSHLWRKCSYWFKSIDSISLAKNRSKEQFIFTSTSLLESVKLKIRQDSWNALTKSWSEIMVRESLSGLSEWARKLFYSDRNFGAHTANHFICSGTSKVLKSLFRSAVHSKWDISHSEGHLGMKTIMAALLKGCS